MFRLRRYARRAVGRRVLGRWWWVPFTAVAVMTPRTTTRRRSATNSVQIHLTGQDLLELERARQQKIAQARAAAAEAQAAHMATLPKPARWLHTQYGAGGTLGLFALALALAFIFNWPWLLLVETIALAILDWRDLATLHNAIPWTVWRVEGSRWRYYGLGALLWLYGWTFLPAVYAIQAWRSTGALDAADHAALQARIAALEAEVLPASTPAKPARPPAHD